MAMEQGAVVPVERKPRGVNWLYVTPMLAAPILPLCTWQAPLPWHAMHQSKLTHSSTYCIVSVCSSTCTAQSSSRPCVGVRWLDRCLLDPWSMADHTLECPLIPIKQWHINLYIQTYNPSSIRQRRRMNRFNVQFCCCCAV